MKFWNKDILYDNHSSGNNQNPYLIPLSIIVAGALMASALYFSNGGGPSVNNANLGGGVDAGPPPAQEAGSLDSIKNVTSEDHIRGDVNAPVKIVEFSDFECPFCQRFHPTLQQIVEEYNGQVAWVYRHFPLTSIHPDAQKAAEASECAAEQGGNTAFWNYADALFQSTSLEKAQLLVIAQQQGLNSSSFSKCLNDGKYEQAVQDDATDGIATGAQGTPFSVVIAPNGKKFVINGAQPYSALKATIDLALSEQ